MEKFTSVIDKNKDLEYKLKGSFEEEKKDKDFKEMVDKIDLSEDKLMKYTFLQDNEQVELRFFPQEASEVILLLLCNLQEDNVSKNYYDELIHARKIYKEMKMKESDV